MSEAAVVKALSSLAFFHYAITFLVGDLVPLSRASRAIGLFNT